MQWVTANVGIHHVHHINAKIPFYRLNEAMNKIPALQNPKTTSLSIREIRRCLRLKVWDEDDNRMIGLRELRKSRFQPIPQVSSHI